eukprot:2011786-Prymnesium_polylepis.1
MVAAVVVAMEEATRAAVARVAAMEGEEREAGVVEAVTMKVATVVAMEEAARTVVARVAVARAAVERLAAMVGGREAVVMEAVTTKVATVV